MKLQVIAHYIGLSTLYFTENNIVTNGYCPLYRAVYGLTWWHYNMYTVIAHYIGLSTFKTIFRFVPRYDRYCPLYRAVYDGFET